MSELSGGTAAQPNNCIRNLGCEIRSFRFNSGASNVENRTAFLLLACALNVFTNFDVIDLFGRN